MNEKWFVGESLRVLVCALALISSAPEKAVAQIDLSGDWFVELTITFGGGPVGGVDEEWTMTQVGTSLSLTRDTSTYVGTIDPMTGAFSVSGPGWCHEPSVITGTATDNDNFNAVWPTEMQIPTLCQPVTIGVSGRRNQCGNGVVDAGEQCDDGNSDGLDCCTETCLFAPQWRCDDGEPTTSDEACVAGACTPGVVEEFQVNTYTPGSQIVPTVAIRSDGDFVATWASGDQDGQFSGVFAQRYAADGSPLDTEFQVNSSFAGSQSLPVVGVSSDGSLLFIWATFSVNEGIYARRFSSLGQPLSGDLRLDASTNPTDPDIATNPHGRALVVWESDEGMFGRLLDSAGATVGPPFPIGTGVTRDPAVAADALGRFIVVWVAYTGGDPGVWMQRFDNDAQPLGEAQAVSLFSTGTSSPTPDVAADNLGNSIVVWSAPAGVSDRNVFGRLFDQDGVPRGGAFRVDLFPGQDEDPSVCMSPHGEFVVAWGTDAGEVFSPSGGVDVAVRRYFQDGTPDGNGLILNGLLVDNQERPVVACDTDGGFVAVWENQTQFPGLQNQWDVFAKQLSLPPTRDDSFKCYKVRDRRDPPFGQVTVSLSDQFESRDFDLRKPLLLCNPSAFSGEAPQATEHFACYKMRGGKFPVAQRPRVLASGRLGVHRLELVKPFVLCVPSRKTLLP